MDTPELEQIKEVTITQSGEDYLQQARAEKLLKDRQETDRFREDLMMKMMNTIKEYGDRIIELRDKQMADRVQFDILKGHLTIMVSEHENLFNRDSGFDSVEFAADYIEAAKALKHLGRTGDKIEEVTAWMNDVDSLPFKK